MRTAMNVASATSPKRTTSVATLKACSWVGRSGFMISAADPDRGGVDDGADQLRVAHAGGARGLGDQAQLGEARDGVHLEALWHSILAEAEIDAGHAAATERTARLEAQGEKLLAHLGRDRGRNLVTARPGGVFVLVVVPAGLGNDLHDRERPIFDQAHRELPPLDERLDQDQAAVAPGLLDRRVKLRGAPDDRDPD